MDEFVALHTVQLMSSNVPEHLWESLYFKLKLEVTGCVSICVFAVLYFK